MKQVKIILLVSSLLFFVGCGVTKKLEYKENWGGNYTLVEYNCCGDTATNVNMKVVKQVGEKYFWKLYLNNSVADSIFGEALYKNKKLKFFVSNIETASKYFINNLSISDAVFVMEFEKSKNYYTWWYNELKNYRRGKALFSGIDYHFRIIDKR